ncbi:putative transposase, Ptta/En/Spm, plant [Helianthus anomalus]
MFSLLFVFVYLMADVMPRGHGGDGAGDPPNPDPFRRGTHEIDAVPPRKVRGKAKNQKLRRMVKAGGRVSLTFDRDVTYTPVGVPSDLFSREVGLYMWRTIPFDRMGWEKVPTPYKEAVMSHLKENFNFDEVEHDLEARDLKGGIRQVLMKRYSDRKNYAKREFRENGGYNDVESERAHHPKDMPYENWLRTIDHFLDPKYIARSEVNARVRQLQKFPNRGGTSSYSSTAYKHGLKRLDTYRKTHTDKDGNFVDLVAEQNYLNLEREIMGGESSGSNQPNEVAVFQNVLGDRRGWFRGLGPKPSNKPSNTCNAQPQTAQPFSEEYVSTLFQSPAFINQLESFLAARGKQVAPDDEYDDEYDDDDLT